MVAAEDILRDAEAFVGHHLDLLKLLLGEHKQTCVGIRNHQEILECVGIAASRHKQLIEGFYNLFKLKVAFAHGNL